MSYFASFVVWMCTTLFVWYVIEVITKVWKGEAQRCMVCGKQSRTVFCSRDCETLYKSHYK